MKFIFGGFIALVFLFSSLMLTEKYSSYAQFVVYVSFLLIIFTFILFYRKKILINSFLSILVYLYVLVCIISALKNTDISLVFSAFIFLSLFLATVVVIPSIYPNNQNENIFKIVILTHIPLLLLSFVESGYGFLTTSSFKGIFYNPNSFGTVAVTLFAVVFSLLLSKVEKYIANTQNPKEQFIKVKLFLLSIISFSLIWLVVISSSRTSFMAVILLTSLGIFSIAIHLIKHGKIGNLILKGSVAGIALLCLSFLINKFSNFNDYLYYNIIMKFQNKSDDLLDLRGDIWKKTFEEAGLFGKGSDYFSQQVGMGAHNTFISILGLYGWVPLILFLVILLALIYLSVRYILVEKNDKYKYLPLLIIMTFVILSMGEVMLYKLSMLVMFCTIGSTFRPRFIKFK